jgi:hypothetical protein
MKKYPLGYGIVFITQKAMMAILVVCLLACQGSTQPTVQEAGEQMVPGSVPCKSWQAYPWLQGREPEGGCLFNCFPAPQGYIREAVSEGSFEEWLRFLPMLPQQSPVKLHNGSLKYRQDVHAAVVDIDVGKRDLQQCADAVMRLRAEYLFAMGRQETIRFNFTNGMACPYVKWREGYRIRQEGNQVAWYMGGQYDGSYTGFRRYLDLVFIYAGSASLQKELSRVHDFREVKGGDVLIQGGSPGHAVIVLDVARDAKGHKVFLLAQSYMPAQDIHVLKNPESPGTAWYSLHEDDRMIATPEWTFYREDLRRF